MTDSTHSLGLETSHSIKNDPCRVMKLQHRFSSRVIDWSYAIKESVS